MEVLILTLRPLMLVGLFLVGSGLATVSAERSGSDVLSLVVTPALAAQTCDRCDYSGGYPSCCLGCGTGPGEDMGYGCYTPDPNQVCQFEDFCEETELTLPSGEMVLVATDACADADPVPVQSDPVPTLRARAEALLSAVSRDGASLASLVLAGAKAMGWTTLGRRFAAWRSELRR